MKNPKKNIHSSKLDAFSDVSIAKKDYEKVTGGFLFKMLDDIRCGVDRSFSRLFGGNGDGVW